MAILANVIMAPGGIIAWIFVGLLAGWSAGLYMKGSGYGLFRDIALGLVGALLGGFFSGFFLNEATGFIGSVLIAFVGACLLIAAVRAISPRQSRV